MLPQSHSWQKNQNGAPLTFHAKDCKNSRYAYFIGNSLACSLKLYIWWWYSVTPNRRLWSTQFWNYYNEASGGHCEATWWAWRPAAQYDCLKHLQGFNPSSRSTWSFFCPSFSLYSMSSHFCQVLILWTLKRPAVVLPMWTINIFKLCCMYLICSHPNILSEPRIMKQWWLCFMRHSTIGKPT